MGIVEVVGLLDQYVGELYDTLRIESKSGRWEKAKDNFDGGLPLNNIVLFRRDGWAARWTCGQDLQRIRHI